MLKKAVILARGLGTRMRGGGGVAELPHQQHHAVSTGIKALVIVGRPMIDYSLAALAEAGINNVCLVIGPEHSAIREHCAKLPKSKLHIDFAIQEQPRGTADAVRAAREFAGDDQFIVLNSDNYYPSSAIRALAQLDNQGLIGFSREGLLQGNIDFERLNKFAILDVDSNNYLRGIIEKPSPEQLANAGIAPPISMNCWRFGPGIFTACDKIGLSARGELELVSAVQFGIDQLGLRWQVVASGEPIWDLTTAADITAVTQALEKIDVQL